MPNPELFPFKSAHSHAAPPRIDPHPKPTLSHGPCSLSLSPCTGVTVTMKDGYSWSLTDSDREGMIDAFQYTGTAGIPPLLTQLRLLQQREHRPQLPSSAWTVAVTNGSQDGLAKMAETLLGPGETVLVETPTYSGALSIFRPLRCNIVGLPCDGFGLIPEDLEAALRQWDEAVCGARPKVLYCIPVGQNPAGSTMPLERRRRVYELACEFDLIVLEDDPYYFLDYGEAPAPADPSQFRRPTVPSMWSMDRQGRVVRFDSLSKVFSSGLRLGYVTGPVGLVNAMLLNVQATNLHSTGIAQLMAARFLEHLGEDGWRRHVDAVSLFYLRRRDVLLGFVDRHLRGLVEYSVPTAGMFVWFKLLHVTDSKKLIEHSARKALVLLVPGQVFMPDNSPSNYVRASFSLATESDMEIAMQRLAQVLKEEGTTSEEG